MLYSKKAGVLAAFLAILLLVPSGIHAFNGNSLIGAGLNAGAFFPTVSDDSSPNINNNLALKFDIALRLTREWELEAGFGYIRNGLFQCGTRVADIHSYPMAVNIRRNLYTWGIFIPYLKAGAGYVLNDIDLSGISGKAGIENTYSLNGGLGMDIHLTKKFIFNFDFGYMYYKPDIRIRHNGTDEKISFDMSGITATVGLRFYFR
ncbi:MAG: hypothetical protein B5M55_07960 [Desulfococcus sp. 4484_242]|nr:MAG: hypothetical protein B5M55_07960 [Desulfococcus sp. 4484_242]